MRRALPFFIPAAVLAVAAVVLFAMGRAERRLIEARREFVMLQFDRAQAAAGAVGEPGIAARWLPGFAARLSGARAQRGAAEYWAARQGGAETTGPAAARGEADAQLLLLAANQKYRRVDFKREPRLLLQDLREVVNAYADVLKRAPWQFDAAYNYQYLARVRAALARSAPARPASSLPMPLAPPSRTIHGRSGAESPGLQTNEFKVIVPHQSDERREEQEAGKSAPRARKG
jgi:hypothetical protein